MKGLTLYMSGTDKQGPNEDTRQQNCTQEERLKRALELLVRHLLSELSNNAQKIPDGSPEQIADMTQA
jgi:hypothetical protein